MKEQVLGRPIYIGIYARYYFAKLVHVDQYYVHNLNLLPSVKDLPFMDGERSMMAEGSMSMVE